MKVLKYILFLVLLLPFETATSSYNDNTLNGMFKDAAKETNIPVNLLRAVCHVESKHNVKIKRVWDGGSYSYGICQIKLGTAKMMGFSGKETELIQVRTNIRYAARYLAHQLKRYNNNYEKAIVSYNRGSYTNQRTQSYSEKVALAFLNETLKGK